MNPFDTVPVESDKHFIGRRRETALIERVIAEGKRPPHRLKGFLITGEEGVGKTSLILHLQRIAERERYLIVSTNAAEHKQHNPLVSYLWDLLRQLIKQTEQLGLPEDPNANADVFEGIPDFSLYKAALRGLPLETAQLQTLTQFEFPSWYYAYVHNPHSEVGASPLVPWINDVQNILQLAESRAGVPGCFMSLDNVEALSAEDARILLDAVRAVHEATGGCGVSFVLGGAPNLRRHAQRQRGVANLFHDLRISDWDFDEVAEYVRRPELQERGLQVLDEDVQRFLDDTEGSPAILSMLCSYIFDARTSNEQQRFEPSETVIERVITELEGASNPHVVDRIKSASSRELEELSEIASFNGWTVAEIIRFHRFGAWITNTQIDVPALEQRLEVLRSLYTRRGILKKDPQIGVQGTSLERAYLRMLARRSGIKWAPEFHGRVPHYDDWVAQAVQSWIVDYSDSVGFPLHKWTTWLAPHDDLPRTLDERVSEYLSDLRSGSAHPTRDDRSTLRMVEVDGRLVYKVVEVESPLRDLASPLRSVNVDLLVVTFHIGDHGDAIVQLFRMPSTPSAGFDAIFKALEQVSSVLDLRAVEHWQGHVELPSLRELMARAEQQRNSALLQPCVYACIMEGRSAFDRLEFDNSFDWFSLANSIHEDLVPESDRANAKNGLAFVSIAMGSSYWRGLEDAFRQVLNMYSTDATKSNRAMTRYDIGYLQAATGRFHEAELTCREALNDPGAGTQPGYLYIKLCEVDGLNIAKYRDAEMARDPIVAVAIYCTLGYIHAMQGQAQEADAAFAEALGRDGSYYMVHRALGHYQLRKGRAADALKSFEQALDCYNALVEKRANTPRAIPLGALTPLQEELAFARRLSVPSGRRS